ncbi:MAG: ParM/StbA family protein [Clostridiales bacterium]|nr:ParM/StbA family protein [Clostridiales bacterium]
MVIAVDTGNKQVKTHHFAFLSGILQYDSLPATVQLEDYFKYNKKYYVLSNRREEYMRDKSESPRYFLLTLLGIVKELDLQDEKEQVYKKDKIFSVTLLAGLPPAHMENAELKRKFKSYFRTPDPVKVTYKGRVWTIRVNKVYVYAQCYAALMPLYGSLKAYPRVLGIDIGGFTADYIMMERGRLGIDNTDSMENGVILLYRDIRKECLKKYDAIIEEPDVDEILSGNTGLYEKEITAAVEKAADRFVERLLANFREMQIDLKRCHTVFMGGGSALLRKYISRSTLLNGPVFIDDIHANVKGYELLYQLSQRRPGGE